MLPLVKKSIFRPTCLFRTVLACKRSVHLHFSPDSGEITFIFYIINILKRVNVTEMFPSSSVWRLFAGGLVSLVALLSWHSFITCSQVWAGWGFIYSRYEFVLLWFQMDILLQLACSNSWIGALFSNQFFSLSDNNATVLCYKNGTNWLSYSCYMIPVWYFSVLYRLYTYTSSSILLFYNIYN